MNATIDEIKTTTGEKVSYAVDEIQKRSNFSRTGYNDFNSEILMYGTAAFVLLGAAVGLEFESETALETARNIGLGTCITLSIFPGFPLGVNALSYSYGLGRPSSGEDEAKWKKIGSSVMKYSSLALAFTGAAIGAGVKLSSQFAEAISTYTPIVIDPAMSAIENMAVGAFVGGLAPIVPVAVATGVGCTLGAGAVAVEFAGKAAGYVSKAVTFPFQDTIKDKADSYREKRSIAAQLDI